MNSTGHIAGGVFGFAGARLRADALERRFGAALALRVGDLRVVDFAAAALVAGALRVAPVLRGAARLATGLEEAVAVAPPSSAHLPESTRCAASATASAISEPSFEALFIICVAAALALSAASRPASRIALRAFGLAAIAAAAAVNPAASISRLIAALAILSKVVLLDPPLLLLLPPRREDFAIAASHVLFCPAQSGSGPKRFRNRGDCMQVKGSRRTTRQPPSTWSATGRSSPEGLGWLVRPAPPKRTEPTSLLNHETSDHLLSLLDCRHIMLWLGAINKTCISV
jgi:hypothetical protein